MENNTTHICKYCNAETNQPDEQCYANPNNNTMENKQQTSMQELLAQLKEERNNLPIPKEWANCLRSIEIVIEKHYLDKEKEQMIEFAQEVFRNRYNQITQSLGNIADEIYKETYGE